MKNKLRIIGGEWRSRQIRFDEVNGLRPTPARVRETLFNWLQHDIAASHCLDLFAGSGALGFEAASRGAARVVMVEQDSRACRSLAANKAALGGVQIQVVRQEVFRYLAQCDLSFSLVFLDPPFFKGLAVQTCQWLEDKQCLSRGAKIYVETEKKADISGIPVGWEMLKSQLAGDVAAYLFDAG